jgi:hypothetical protein
MYAGPGLHSSLSSDFQSIIGQPRIVPLFSSYSGNGSNAQYTVTGFAGVTVVSATGNGGNFQLVLQPTIVVNANATVQAGPQAGSAFIYASPPFGLTDGAVAQTSSQSGSSAGSGSGSSGSSVCSGTGNGSGNNRNGSGTNGSGGKGK